MSRFIVNRSWFSARVSLIALVLGFFSPDISCCAETQVTPQNPVTREARVAFPEINRLIDGNQLDRAQARLKELASAGGENYKTLYLEALILFKKQQHSESLRILERALATQKYDPDLYVLAGMNWVALNRIQLARPFYVAASRLAPEDPQIRYHTGRMYYTNQEFELAEKEFRKVLELNPSFVKAYDNLGLALEALTKEEEAIQAYRKATELTQQQGLTYEWPFVNLAKLLVKKNRFDEALELARKATTVNPRSAEAYLVLGEALNKQGLSQEAVEALKVAAQNDPLFSRPHYLLGQIYRKQGQLQAAQKELETFQELQRREKEKAPVR